MNAQSLSERKKKRVDIVERGEERDFSFLSLSLSHPLFFVSLDHILRGSVSPPPPRARALKWERVVRGYASVCHTSPSYFNYYQPIITCVRVWGEGVSVRL